VPTGSDFPLARYVGSLACRRQKLISWHSNASPTHPLADSTHTGNPPLAAAAAAVLTPLIPDHAAAVAAAVLSHSGMSLFLISTALNSPVLPSVKTTLKYFRPA